MAFPLRDGMGPRLGNGISPCFFAFLRGGIWQAVPKSFLFFGENFLLLVCDAHEMHRQLEVTEMLECKVNLTVQLLVFRETLLHRSCGLYAWKWVMNLSSNGRPT